MTEFKHFISLGYFCSVAMELERMGLRNCSSPFDWVISENFGGVLDNIDNHFKDWCKYDNLFQNTNNRNIYKDLQQGIIFMHDFDGKFSLKNQISAVQEKYNRRIERFYNNILEPTLFLRYVNTEEGRTDELFWVENNHEIAKMLLKSHNKCNEIIYIINSDMRDKVKFPAFFVEKDQNDNVARNCLDKNTLLLEMLNESGTFDRSKNLERWYKRKRERNNLVRRMKRRLHAVVEATSDKYLHEKEYSAN